MLALIRIRNALVSYNSIATCMVDVGYVIRTIKANPQYKELTHLDHLRIENISSIFLSGADTQYYPLYAGLAIAAFQKGRVDIADELAICGFISKNDYVAAIEENDFEAVEWLIRRGVIGDPIVAFVAAAKIQDEQIARLIAQHFLTEDSRVDIIKGLVIQRADVKNTMRWIEAKIIFNNPAI